METLVVPVRALGAAISMTMESAARVRCWVWCLPVRSQELVGLALLHRSSRPRHHLAWEAASWSECSAASSRTAWEDGLALMAALVSVVWVPVALAEQEKDVVTMAVRHSFA